MQHSTTHDRITGLSGLSGVGGFPGMRVRINNRAGLCISMVLRKLGRPPCSAEKWFGYRSNRKPICLDERASIWEEAYLCLHPHRGKIYELCNWFQYFNHSSSPGLTSKPPDDCRGGNPFTIKDHDSPSGLLTLTHTRPRGRVEDSSRWWKRLAPHELCHFRARQVFVFAWHSTRVDGLLPIHVYLNRSEVVRHLSFLGCFFCNAMSLWNGAAVDILRVVWI